MIVGEGGIGLVEHLGLDSETCIYDCRLDASTGVGLHYNESCRFL